MDRNLILAFALSFLVLSLWTLWSGDGHAPVPPGESTVAAEQPTEPAPAAGEQPGYPTLPEAADRQAPAAPARESAPSQAAPAELEIQRIEISQPLYRARLTSLGGSLESWELNEYTDHDGARVQMIPDPSIGGALAGTPFVELGQGDLSRLTWQVARSDATEVVFAWSAQGISLRKTYRFDPEDYALRLTVELENGSASAVAPRFLLDWPVEARPDRDFAEQSIAALHDGSIVMYPVSGLGSPGFIGSLFGRSAVQEYPVMSGEIDWVGFKTTYFLGAVFPDSPTQARARFVVLETSRLGAAQLFFDPVEVPPGQRVSREFRGYLGPKESARLTAFGAGAEASIDSGWRWVAPLTRLFSWLLHALYSVIPNYGVAIILLTIMVRAVTAPLTLRQMRSMERLRRVQPRMKEIQEKFKDDKQRQSEELMKLYRQEKVNPLGGCLPMLLQLPVFVGLFYALQSSMELRHAPFVGWIDDLSAPDSLFVIPGLNFPLRVLPIVMGATMFFQQKITPMQTPDPAQARMMMTVMPIMMTVLFYGFPSGLVLYWMLSNVLAIGHQLWIGRKMEPIGGADQPAKA